MKLFEKKDLASRVGLLDEIRGALILLVILYHAVMLFYQASPFPVLVPSWLESSWLQALVYAGAGIFVLISGACCHFSRNNFRRGMILFLIACVITGVTVVFHNGDFQVLWGILHLLGFSMILYDFLSYPLSKCKAVWAVPVLCVLFVLTFRLQDRALGIPYLWEFSLPMNHVQWLFPLGLTYPGFFSADYYPLMPWLFLFLIGTFWGRHLAERRAPQWVYDTHCKPLAAVGRVTLWIYLIHIPLLYDIYYLTALCMGLV